MPYEPPKGRLKTRKRSFQDVVRDIRHIVCAVIRIRPNAANVGQYQAFALGSGFFVSHSVFLTCHHVINDPANPHQDGDVYHLVSNVPGQAGGVHIINNVQVNQTLHLFPDDDMALLIADGNPTQPYASLNFGEVLTGAEIGVAGYPLPTLVTDRMAPSATGISYIGSRGES